MARRNEQMTKRKEKERIKMHQLGSIRLQVTRKYISNMPKPQWSPSPWTVWAEGWAAGLTAAGGWSFPHHSPGSAWLTELVVTWIRFTPSPDNVQGAGLVQKHLATYSHFIGLEWLLYLLLNQSLQRNMFTYRSIKPTYRISVRSSLAKTRVPQTQH